MLYETFTRWVIGWLEEKEKNVTSIQWKMIRMSIKNSNRKILERFKFINYKCRTAELTRVATMGNENWEDEVSELICIKAQISESKKFRLVRNGGWTNNSKICRFLEFM